jgi:hypothetical protein
VKNAQNYRAGIYSGIIIEVLLEIFILQIISLELDSRLILHYVRFFKCQRE